MALLTDVKAAYRLIDETDSHLFGHDLTNNNTVTFGAGKINNAASFNGTDNYLSCSIDAGGDFTIGDNDFSFSFWVRWDSSQVGVDESFIGTANGDWIVTKKSNERLRFQINEDSGGVLICEVTTALNHSQWYFVVCEYSAADDEIRMRIDDSDALERIISTTGKTPRDRSTDFRIGSTNASNFLDCDIENVLVRKGSLWTASEVTEMHNSGSGLDYFAMRDRWEVFYPLHEDGSDVRGHRFAQLSPTGTPTFSAAKVGNGAAFTGTANRYTSQDPVFKNIGAESISGSFWINPDTLANAGIMGQNNSSYSVQLLSSGKIRFRIDTTTGASILDTDTLVSTGTWTHVFWYYDNASDEMGVSINNATAKTLATSGRLEYSSTSFTLASIATSNHYDGMLNMVRFVRGEVLTTAERNADYNSGSGVEFASELELDYTSAAGAKRVKVQAKAAQIGGSGTQDCMGLYIDENSLPSELHDSDEATAEGAGAGSLRLSTDAAGANMIPLRVLSFVPAPGGGTTRCRLNNNSTLDGTSGTDVYAWWIPDGNDKVQPPANHVYGAQAVEDGSYWALDEDPSGSAPQMLDFGSNGNDGTTSGLIAGNSVSGKVGNALDFDSADYVEIAHDASLSFDTSFTVSAWFNMSASLSGWRTIVAKRDAGLTPAAEWGINANQEGGTDLFQVFFYNGSFHTHTVSFSSNFSAGTWYKVGFTCEESGADVITKIYKDGVLLDTKTHTSQALATSSNRVRIGATRYSGTDAEHWDGQIDEVGVQSGVLSADQITTLYNNQNNPGAFWDSTAAVTTPGASGVTGTLSLTDGGETLAFTGNVPVTGTMAITDTGESVAFTGNVPVTGTMSLTDGGETIAFSGIQSTTGTMDLTDAGEIISMTGNVPITGDLAITDGGETLSFTGSIGLSGTMAITDGGETIQMTGSVPITGTFSLTDGGETVTFTNAVSLVARNPFKVKAETRIFTVYPTC